jgi:GNAT superfamily N-acetyltransferase
MDDPEVRVARADDAPTVTGIITRAFHQDPTWSHVFPDPEARPEQYRRFWGLLVDGALRYPWVWLTPGDTATAVWIPPGGTELPAEVEDRLEVTLEEWFGAAAARLLATLEVFGANHPHDVPHYYLSLLGTDVPFRGRGIGLALLQDNLRRLDLEEAPAYLEASDSANVPLYERYGFRPVGAFDVPEGGPEVVTMWRDPR